MVSPEETYRAAILRACEAHLVRVKAARDTRNLAVSMAAVFGEHDPRPYRARSAIYAKAKNAYEKAIASSEAQRAKDEAIALATFHATNEVLSAASDELGALRNGLEYRPRDENRADAPSGEPS